MSKAAARLAAVARPNRIPVRLRVTLAFTTAMALVLAAVGLFLYFRLGAQLDVTIDQGLRSRAADLRGNALVAQEKSRTGPAVRSPLATQGESVVQILDPSGRVRASPPSLRRKSPLSPEQLARARRETVVLTTSREDEGEARWLATPVQVGATKRIIVVGTSLERRDDAVGNLGRLLLIGGPVALALAALTGYGALTVALRPVESMRRRAADIHHAAPGERLPVAPARDEIGRLGDTLNTMLARLEEAFARERSFVADASHELRTPLAILRTELELALGPGRSPSEVEQGLRSAAEETERLVLLAEDLLIIARSDQGRLPVRPRRVEAMAVLNACCERFRGRAGRQGIEIAVTTSPSLEIVADEIRLEQAIGNLLENALRHARRRVELSAHAVGGCVELHVRDDGSGFPPGFLVAAFERFSRADTARGRGGTGLGLAIAAAIARAHGGSAAARNLVGGGADVWLSLPRETD